MTRRWSAAAILVCALAAAHAAPPAVAATPARAIAELNAERQANGIPAGITVDPTLSADCAAHDRYMADGHGLTHQETPGQLGYSAGGAYAARNAVLAEGASWDHGDPYRVAPLHLDQLLAPRLDDAGSADVDGFTCTTTFPGWTRAAPAAPVVYTDPGPHGAAPPSEVQREAPFTPGDLVGLQQPARTGPVLVVLADAPGQEPEDNPASLTQVSLIGPRGPVAVRVVDGRTRVPGGGTLAPYISPGGFIIPVLALTPGATYTAHVMVTFAGLRIPHTWSFTARIPPQSTLSARGETLSFTSRSPAPIKVVFTRAGGGTAPGLQLRPGEHVRLHLPPGAWQVCGHQRATRRFDRYDACLTLVVTGHPLLSLRRPVVHGERLVFPLRFSRVLAGRRARLTLTPLSRACAGCRVQAGRPRSRWIVLRGHSVTVALPGAGRGVRVRLVVGSFVAGGAPYGSARTTYSWLHP